MPRHSKFPELSVYDAVLELNLGILKPVYRNRPWNECRLRREAVSAHIPLRSSADEQGAGGKEGGEHRHAVGGDRGVEGCGWTRR
jgi:hypothetical protein